MAAADCNKTPILWPCQSMHDKPFWRKKSVKARVHLQIKSAMKRESVDM
jgi:hypothetical protein